MENFMTPWRSQVLSLLRIVTGLSILQFGTAKILKFPVVPGMDKLTPTTWPAGIAGCIELVLGTLLVLGLFTRPVAFVLSGLMAFAYFLGHASGNIFPILNGGTLAIMFCFACLYLSTAGGGPLSVDALVRNKE